MGENSFTHSESRHVETNFYVLRNVHYRFNKIDTRKLTSPDYYYKRSHAYNTGGRVV